jgi:CRISPR/Cas system-associated exonuclease Cas4 (RecB family)
VGSVESLAAPIAWSFSRLTDFEKCPRLAYLKYIEKRPEPPTINRTAADRGTALHAAAEAYVKGEAQMLDPGLEKVKARIEEYREAYAKGLVEVEEDWAFDLEWQRTGWFDANCWARIKLDIFVKWDDGCWEVADYKSGKRYGNEVKHSQQGLLYAIAAFMRHPEMERVRIRFVYIDLGEESTKEYDRATVMRMWPMWNERARTFTFSQNWPVKPNQVNCRFCPYSPNNGGDGSCPAGVELGPKKSKSK